MSILDDVEKRTLQRYSVTVGNKEVKMPKPDTTRWKIWDLAKAGMSVKEIAAKVGKTLGYVHTELRVLKLSGLLDPATLKPRGSTAMERQIFAMGGMAANVEEIKVVSCPRCKCRFQVLS